MCDTFTVLPASSLGGKTWFAKNSDRSPNEPNLIINQPAAEYDLNATPDVALTYISIPQAERTFGLLMVKPSWTWGCEMGMNEHGVSIGNEAVFTKGSYAETGLTGMDICRLVLERCATAKEGMELIGALIETHGQGGNSGFDKEFFYDNSFLISDASEAYVLESAGKQWVAKQIEDLYAISNTLTLETDWTFSGGVPTGGKYNFAKKHTNKLYQHFSGALNRRYIVYSELLDDRDGKVQKSIAKTFLGSAYTEKRGTARGIDYRTCRRTLRRHPDDTNAGRVESPCMHYGDRHSDQTTGSLITCVQDKLVALTGGSTPCQSVFMQFSLMGDLPFGSDPVAAEAYWMKRELIQRNLLGGHIARTPFLQRVKLAEEEVDLLAGGFTEASATSLNRQIFEVEEKVVDQFFSQCSRELDDISPKHGAAAFKSRWNEKNTVFLDRLAELGV